MIALSQSLSQCETPRTYEARAASPLLSPETHSSTAKSTHRVQEHVQGTSGVQGPLQSELTREGPRTLFRSKTYQADTLVKLVYTGTKLAATKYNVSARKAGKLEPNVSYYFCKALSVVADKSAEYYWGVLTAKLGEPISSFGTRSTGPNEVGKTTAIASDQMKYYVIGILGRGSTSNVFHALDKSGKEVALKAYVKSIDAQKYSLDSDDFARIAKEATEREAKRP